MAPEFSLQNRSLITKDVGTYQFGLRSFSNIWWEGSKRLGTPFNDIRPRNIGANGQIFDPAKIPLHQRIEAYGAVYPSILGGGYYLYNSFNNKDD